MCVYSMIVDHYDNKWRLWQELPKLTPTSITPPVRIPTQEDIDEFYKLLEWAREYDKRTGQEDCELEEKKSKLLELARKLGIEISFKE